MPFRHLVIVGASAAGITAAEAIRSVDPGANLTVVAAEREEPYARIFVPKRLSEELPVSRLAMRPPGLWARLAARAILGRSAVGLDNDQHELWLDDGTRLPYDGLLVATGASPAQLSCPGQGLDRVSGLRTWADAERIAGWLRSARQVLVIGAGLVSVKALEALVRRPLALTVVASSAQVLGQLLDPAPAAAVKARMEARGVRVLTGADVVRLEGDGRVERAVLSTGEILPCDLALVGKGVIPNAAWLAGSGLDSPQGIPIDDRCRTSLPDVYAAGDVAAAHDLARGSARINAMWPNAVAQGRVAGLNMAGSPATYDGSLSMNIGAFFDLPAAAVGQSRPRSSEYREHVLSADGERYRKIVEHEGRIVGAMLTGDLRPAGALQSLIRRRAPLAEWEPLLARRQFTLPARIGAIARRI